MRLLRDSEVWNPSETTEEEFILLERCQECLAQKSGYKLDSSVFGQVDTLSVRRVEIVDDRIDHTRQQLIIVVVEHTDIVH